MKYRQFTKKELEWIKKFELIMGKAPDTLFMFVSGAVNIGTKDKDNNRYLKNYSMDNEQPWITIRTKMEVDGGDW